MSEWWDILLWGIFLFQTFCPLFRLFDWTNTFWLNKYFLIDCTPNSFSLNKREAHLVLQFKIFGSPFCGGGGERMWAFFKYCANGGFPINFAFSVIWVFGGKKYTIFCQNLCFRHFFIKLLIHFNPQSSSNSTQNGETKIFTKCMDHCCWDNFVFVWIFDV